MLISTLGPKYSNSEVAAEHWLKELGEEGSVALHRTPEDAIAALISGEVDLCVLCIVYPELNHIVFQNLNKIRIENVFCLPTLNMVIAGNKDGKTACTHPAPADLLGEQYDIRFVTSNSDAALRVKAGEYDVCVTTSVAARKNELPIIHDYGVVNMGWSVFSRM